MADPFAPLCAIWYTAFDCSQLPTHTLVTYRDQLDFMPSDQWRVRVRDGLAVAIEALSYPSDECIKMVQGLPCCRRWMIWLQWRFGATFISFTDGRDYEESANDHPAVHGLHRGYFGMHSFTA
ncbi:hypothetical protein M9H77_36793 [Catharanthus roseus]|uniref:Uncharacterized protein n=1 Tax=Catharanthus roseus TaxID=4058 RepID=A0ACB9ZTN4_CATRO|nr:hypothetical protein M9H77_36793 [Catharanthus roseus]